VHGGDAALCLIPSTTCSLFAVDCGARYWCSVGGICSLCSDVGSWIRHLLGVRLLLGPDDYHDDELVMMMTMMTMLLLCCCNLCVLLFPALFKQTIGRPIAVMLNEVIYLPDRDRNRYGNAGLQIKSRPTLRPRHEPRVCCRDPDRGRNQKF